MLCETGTRMMGAARFFEWSQFAALVIWGAIGIGRAVAQHRRGIPVLTIDRQRTRSQMAWDSVALLCLLAWVYEVVAYGWALPFHLPPAAWHQVLVERIPLRALGVAVVASALLLYALALDCLGESWRSGVDRDHPGPLVTTRLYEWTRHPIYLAFILLFFGSFLVIGRAVFLVLAVMWAIVLNGFMVREERFLAALYGESYRNYCRQVPRYFNWRKLSFHRGR